MDKPEYAGNMETEGMVRMHQYHQPGFSSAKKRRKVFVPSNEQVEIAMHRIKCAVEKKLDGMLRADSDREAIAYLERNVHNRDRQLGDRKQGHFRKVLLVAWKKLRELNQVVFDEDRFMFILNYRFSNPERRSHRQKYPAGQLAMRAR